MASRPSPDQARQAQLADHDSLDLDNPTYVAPAVALGARYLLKGCTATTSAGIRTAATGESVWTRDDAPTRHRRLGPLRG